MRRRRSNSRLRSNSSDDHHDHTTNDVSSSSSIKGNSKSQRTNDKISVSNNEAADRYVKNCKQFDVRVDAGVVIALKTGYCSNFNYYHHHHHHHHHYHHYHHYHHHHYHNHHHYYYYSIDGLFCNQQKALVKVRCYR